MLTKTLFFVCGVFLLLLSGCDQEPAPPSKLEPRTIYEGEGRIIRTEFAACACCGGWWLATTNPADSVLLGYLSDDAGFLQDSNLTFPIDVKYKIYTDSTQCWDIRHYAHPIYLKKK